MKKSLLYVAYIKYYEKHKEIKAQIDKKLVEKEEIVNELDELRQKRRKHRFILKKNQKSQD